MFVLKTCLFPRNPGPLHSREVFVDRALTMIDGTAAVCCLAKGFFSEGGVAYFLFSPPKLTSFTWFVIGIGFSHSYIKSLDLGTFF